MINVAVVITDGSEELEAVTVVDILRRSNSLKATLVVLGDHLQVQCSRNFKIIGDVLFKDFNWDDIDAIVLPGGIQGARSFEASSELHQILRKLWNIGKNVSAICASVVALKAAGIAKGASATSHPCVKNELENYYKYEESLPVVEYRDSLTNATLITSRGPGTALTFALAIVSNLAGALEAKEVSNPLMIIQ